MKNIIQTSRECAVCGGDVMIFIVDNRVIKGYAYISVNYLDGKNMKLDWMCPRCMVRVGRHGVPQRKIFRRN